MTDIEKKALALLNECAGQEVYGGWGTFDPNQSPCTRALCRAIEQHEAFRQEVSDALSVYQKADGVEERSRIWDALTRFIIPKTDPLVEVMNEMGFGMSKTASEEFRAALAARGLEIREKKDD